MIEVLNLKQIIYFASLITLGIYLIAILFRAIIGPKVTDRIVAVNMIGTKVIIMICIVSHVLGEGYLVDVALVYALLNFISMVVLSQSYGYVYRKNKAKKEKNNV